MARLQSFILFLLASVVSGFVPHSKPAIVPRTDTELMVIYWSIKSAMDYVGYATGQTDKFQGTGTWSMIKMEREKPEENQADNSKKPAEKKVKAYAGNSGSNKWRESYN